MCEEREFSMEVVCSLCFLIDYVENTNKQLL